MGRSFSFADDDEDPYFVTHAKPEGLEIVKKTAEDLLVCRRRKGEMLFLLRVEEVPFL